MEQQNDFRKVFEKLENMQRAMVTRDEMNRFIETMEILSNPETVEQINQSLRDIDSGNFKEISSVNDI